MKVVVTGVTGMVGEGVLLECLDNPLVDHVLAVSRRSSGHSHPKLGECLLPDFREAASVEARLVGYDACFYCAGVSSLGMSEATYTVVSYDTPLRFAETLLRRNPGMVFVYVTGAHTDGSEKGRMMWARVKGRAENALARLPFKAVYNFRPGLMKPLPGQRHIGGLARFLLGFYPLLRRVFPALTLRQVARAMIRCVQDGPSKTVLEVPDIAALAPSDDG